MALKNNEFDKNEFNNRIEACNKIKDLEQMIASCEEKNKLVQVAISLAILHEPEKNEYIRSIYEPRIEYAINKLGEKGNIYIFSNI